MRAARVIWATSAAIALAACDPAGAVVVDNQSGSTYIALAERSDIPGYPYFDRLAIPASKRLSVGANAVGDPHVGKLSLLGPDCLQAFGVDLTDEGDGGVITIRADGTATFEPGLTDVAPMAENDDRRCPPPPTPEVVPGLD